METINIELIRDFLREGGDKYVPQLSVDCVIFGFHEQQLKVLLLKPRGMESWALPGGFVEQGQDVDAAAIQTLKDRTGLSDIFLDQFHVFGRADRNTHDSMRLYLESIGIEVAAFRWLMQRFVTVGYYALVNFEKVRLQASVMEEKIEWFDLAQIPQLAFDHNEIILKALNALRDHLDSKVIGARLLPELFTMNELQGLYETILGSPLRRNNFQRKMLSLGMLERTEKLYTGGAHKAPYLYRFLEGE